MPINNRNPYTTIHTEGALLPVDLLQRIIAIDSTLGGLDPESYHLPPGEKLNEAINRAWNRLLGIWATFQTARGRLKEGEPGTALTRDRWLLPLFQEMGYGRLQAARAVTLDGKEYRVSHAWGETPFHLVGCGVSIDRPSRGVPGAAKSSPHSLVQELLNRNPDQLWGMVTNGLVLRLLRDNASLTRQAYLEFDLEAMLTGEVYADFVVLWMVCHQSRVESRDQQIESCWLEIWSKVAQEQGTRALEKLRVGVEDALNALGSGFLANPANTALKAKLRSGELTREDYYRQLLRLVYRLIFLFAAEDRDLLLDPKVSPSAHERYMKYYSATRLRQIAESSRGGRHPDLYATLRLVTAMLGGREPTGTGRKGLGLPVLGSFLFSGGALPDLESAELENSALLSAVRSLASIMDGNTRRVVDYKNLGTRELGSVYESLLELHPQINIDAGTFILETVAGNERKTTGSYYTAEDLIKALLDSALDPVILQALNRAGPSIEAQIAALLALKVCDPACGSGHFLIAAARRIARRLAQLRSGDEEPSPEMTRTALRDVIQHCVYGVDINPLSVELCKVNLWLESLEPGKPLSFLESHIQCGDSLVGVAPGLDISEIPDEAFNPCFGDDKATCTALKKRNKRERGGQFGLFGQMRAENSEDASQWLSKRASQIESMPEDTPEQVQAKEKAFIELQEEVTFHQKELEYNIWTAAFFWSIPKSDAELMLAPTQQALVAVRAGDAIKPALQEKVQELSRRLNFLHWELRFPSVFTFEHAGFDCVLGNPPWERIKLQEKEFFSTISPEITNAPGDSDRQRLIESLVTTNPTIWKLFVDAKHAAESQTAFIQNSKRYVLTAVGDINTYPLFAELARKLVVNNGHLGLILPTGIATDYSTRFYFQDIVVKKNLVSLFDFDNSEGIFPAVKPNVRFCLFSIVKGENQEINLAAQLVSPENLKNPDRRYKLDIADIQLVYPNTLNCPMFRLSTDAQLVTKIHRRQPVLLQKGNDTKNPWNIQFSAMFHMSNDSGLFKKREELEALSCAMAGNIFRKGDKVFIPLYESKLAHQFNHRLATFDGIPSKNRFKIHAGTNESSFNDLVNPFYTILPRYWVDEKEVLLKANSDRKWFLGFRNAISATADSRSLVATILPWSGVGNSMPLIIVIGDAVNSALMLGMFNSLVLDYILKQKVSGANLNFYIVEQLPVLPPDSFNPADKEFISVRVLELVYTAYDLRPFAEDMGYNGKPFIWDEDRRAQLRAELDAYYAKLYGLTRDELRYILDPQEVYGPDFPGETFRVLKDKEMRQYGEYRTRRLVLEAWDQLFGSQTARRDEGIIHPPRKAKRRPSYAGTYQLEGKAHPGGQAEVFRATHRVTGEQVALKRMLSQTIKDAKDRMRREITSLLQIDHPNVMPILEYGEDFTWYTMPFALKSLYETNSPIPLPDLLEIARSVAQGLSVGHNQGDIHRDVTPRNIFQIDRYPNQLRWVIGDWGLVRQQGLTGTMVTQAEGGFGTQGFAPPELWDDPHNADVRVDVYSLGRVIAWVLTGKWPAPNRPLSPSQAGWAELVSDMTDSDPKKRIKSMEEVLKRLEELAPAKVNEPVPTAETSMSTLPPEPEKPVQEEQAPQPAQESQPMLSDFGLYKCGVCGKMVMGFEKGNHVREKHNGSDVNWEKLR